MHPFCLARFEGITSSKPKDQTVVPRRALVSGPPDSINDLDSEVQKLGNVRTKALVDLEICMIAQNDGNKVL